MGESTDGASVLSRGRVIAAGPYGSWAASRFSPRASAAAASASDVELPAVLSLRVATGDLREPNALPLLLVLVLLLPRPVCEGKLTTGLGGLIPRPNPAPLPLALRLREKLADRPCITLPVLEVVGIGSARARPRGGESGAWDRVGDVVGEPTGDEAERTRGGKSFSLGTIDDSAWFEEEKEAGAPSATPVPSLLSARAVRDARRHGFVLPVGERKDGETGFVDADAEGSALLVEIRRRSPKDDA